MTDHLLPNVHPDAGREAEILASEHELHRPAPGVVAAANFPDYLRLREAAARDPLAFWDAQARELIDWHEPYERVLDESRAPFYRWFVGGRTNIVHNALDRHVRTWRRNKLAIVWAGEKPGEERSFSYYRLWQEVNRFANVLRSMGVRKGDTVTIYMGRVPELPIAMLATAKLGAVHSVIYGGFSWQAVADRIADAQSRVVVTCTPGDLDAVRALARDLPFTVLGVVTGETLRCTMGGEELLALPVSELHRVYESLPERLA